MSVPPGDSSRARRQRLVAFAKLFALAMAFVVGVLAIRFTPLGEWLSEESLGAAISAFGPLAPVVFVAVFAVLLAFWVPGTVLTLAGAAVFGVWAIPLNYLGSLLGAVLGFLLGRRAGEDTLEHLLGARWSAGSRYRRLLEERGFESVLYLRMIPTPYTLISYLAGLSPISLRTYTLATALGIIPASIAFTFLLETAIRVVRAGEWSALASPRVVGAIALYAVALSIPFVLEFGRRRFGWFAKVAVPEDDDTGSPGRSSAPETKE